MASATVVVQKLIDMTEAGELEWSRISRELSSGYVPGMYCKPSAKP